MITGSDQNLYLTIFYDLNQNWNHLGATTPATKPAVPRRVRFDPRRVSYLLTNWRPIAFSADSVGGNRSWFRLTVFGISRAERSSKRVSAAGRARRPDEPAAAAVAPRGAASAHETRYTVATAAVRRTARESTYTDRRTREPACGALVTRGTNFDCSTSRRRCTVECFRSAIAAAPLRAYKRSWSAARTRRRSRRGRDFSAFSAHFIKYNIVIVEVAAAATSFRSRRRAERRRRSWVRDLSSRGINSAG